MTTAQQPDQDESPKQRERHLYGDGQCLQRAARTAGVDLNPDDPAATETGEFLLVLGTVNASSAQRLADLIADALLPSIPADMTSGPAPTPFTPRPPGTDIETTAAWLRCAASLTALPLSVDEPAASPTGEPRIPLGPADQDTVGRLTRLADARNAQLHAVAAHLRAALPHHQVQAPHIAARHGSVLVGPLTLDDAHSLLLVLDPTARTEHVDPCQPAACASLARQLTGAITTAIGTGACQYDPDANEGQPAITIEALPPLHADLLTRRLDGAHA